REAPGGARQNARWSALINCRCPLRRNSHMRIPAAGAAWRTRFAKRVTPQGVKNQERRSALHPPSYLEEETAEASGANAPRACERLRCLKPESSESQLALPLPAGGKRSPVERSEGGRVRGR